MAGKKICSLAVSCMMLFACATAASAEDTKVGYSQSNVWMQGEPVTGENTMYTMLVVPEGFMSAAEPDYSQICYIDQIDSVNWFDAFQKVGTKETLANGKYVIMIGGDQLETPVQVPFHVSNDHAISNMKVVEMAKEDVYTYNNADGEEKTGRSKAFQASISSYSDAVDYYVEFYYTVDGSTYTSKKFPVKDLSLINTEGQVISTFGIQMNGIEVDGTTGTSAIFESLNARIVAPADDDTYTVEFEQEVQQ